MATLDEKILDGPNVGYCSSSEDEAEPNTGEATSLPNDGTPRTGPKGVLADYQRHQKEMKTQKVADELKVWFNKH